MKNKLALALVWTIFSAIVSIRGETIKQEPIVIKTPVANYEQPNFDDYKSCMKALDSCTNLCDGAEECLSKCKKCPVLIKQDVIVQGVNDTDYKDTSNAPTNSTNIIRVTNQIHNIIENNLGDIQAKNENNVHIYPANSPSCDKFGLGCNENGTCCYIVRNHHREKHCGQRCQARVMYEKTVVQCTDETNLNSCRKIVEYKPIRSRRSKHVRDNYKCRYDSEWPFVYCNNRKPLNDRCSSICLSISYLFILQHGVPLHCLNCYKSFGESSKDFVPPFGEDDHFAPPSVENDRDKFNSHDREWIIEKTKCRLQNGTISENCDESKNQVIANDNELGSGDDTNDVVNPGLASFNALDDSDKRENAFRRSKYSLRHKRKLMENN